MSSARPYRPTKHCARCGLTFGTRWAWARHGCELTGQPGELSELRGLVVRVRFPAELQDEEAVERLRDTMGVHRVALAMLRARMFQRSIAPLTEIMRTLTVGLARVAEAMRELQFNRIFAVEPSPLQQAAADASRLTADSFEDVLRRFQAGTRAGEREPFTPIETKTITVRANRSPVPPPHFPKRWAALGNTRRGGVAGERARDNRRGKRGR